MASSRRSPLTTLLCPLLLEGGGRHAYQARKGQAGRSGTRPGQVSQITRQLQLDRGVVAPGGRSQRVLARDRAGQGALLAATKWPEISEAEVLAKILNR